MSANIGSKLSRFSVDRWLFTCILYSAGWETVYMAQAVTGNGEFLPSRQQIPDLIQMLDWDSKGSVFLFSPDQTLREIPDVLWAAMWYSLRTGTFCQLAARMRGIKEDAECLTK